ncbi:hypothetical protein [Actinoplanes sp. NPDC051851]|uniref:hypothetical protein n=1 Tax=Actinoplanes sp. NPDC051851 TaxID=3154753 RepID=UPI00343AE0A0
MTTDFKTLLATAKLPRRTVPVCLRGDLQADFEALERDLEIARNSPASTSMESTGTSSAMEIAQLIEELREEMREHSYIFVLQALPRPEYQRLKDQHPPRQDESGDIVREDVVLDANIDTFLDPLLRACLVDPVLTDAEWADLDEKLTDSQYNLLVNTVHAVNRGGVSIPFSRVASRLLASTADE